MHFIGCEKAHEVSLTRGKDSAANPMASVLLYRSKAGGPPTNPSNPSPENDMDAAEIKKMQDAALSSAVTKILGMTDVTKAHYLAMTTPEAQVAFLAKSTEDMNAEAAAAAAAATAVTEATKARETAVQTDIGKQIAEAMKSVVEPLVAQVTKLAAQVEGFQAADVFKARAQKEFAGHPRGDAFVADTLKSVAGATDEVKKTVEESLTGAISLAKFAGMTNVAVALGGEAPGAGAKESLKALNAKAAELAKARSIPVHEAFVIVSEDPENAALYEQAHHPES